MEIERFRHYRATLKMRTDPRFGILRPGIAPYEGTRFETMALWKIDCEDDPFANRAYDGEFAMETPRGWPVHWVASGDLTDIEPIDDAHS